MALPWSDPVTEPAYCAKHYVWPSGSITNVKYVTPYSDPVLPGVDTMWFKKQASLTIDDEGMVLKIELCPNNHEG